MLHQLTLDKLRDGHEAVRSLNVRQVGRDDGIEALAASIAHHGLLAALVVTPVDPSIEDGEAYVVDGNRRLAALRLLVERGAWPADKPVPVMQPTVPTALKLGDVVTAPEISLAANVMRVAMHPADAYEAYATLSADGLSAEQIAQRFGAPLGEVRKALALGRVAPAVLEAWRKNEIDAKAVQAFTLAADDRQAEKILAAARKKGAYALRGDSIREALGATDWKVKRALKFVGLDAYRDAGGSVAEDMFDGDHLIADPALVLSLAQQKLQAACHRLTAPAPDGAGWAWASLADDLPDGRWSWRHLESTGKPTKEERARLKEIEAEQKRLRDLEERDDELSAADDALWQSLEAEEHAITQAIRDRGFDADARAKSGCILSLDNVSGALSVDYGVVRPGESKKRRGSDDHGAATSSRKKRASRGDPFAVTNALNERLTNQLTKAVATALTATPHVALAALLAGIDADGFGDSPIVAKVDGLNARPVIRDGVIDDDDDGEEFAALFGRYVKMKPDALLRVAAHAASRAVNLRARISDAKPLDQEQAAPLFEALDEEALRQALAQHFDPADYFASVPKDTILAAIAEAIPGDQAAALKSKSRAEIAKFAVAYVPATGWLPPALRAVKPKLVAVDVPAAEVPAPKAEKPATKKGQRKRAQPSPRPAPKAKAKTKAKAKGARKRASAPKRRAA